jgi:hypothetical protein
MRSPLVLNGVEVEGDADPVEHPGGVPAGEILVDGAEIEQHQVVVGATRHEAYALGQQTLGHRRGVAQDPGGVLPELIGVVLAETHGLGRDLALDGSPLAAGKDRLVDQLGVFLGGEDQPSPRAAQRLVGGGGDDVGVLHRVGEHLPGHQADEVGGVDHEHRTDLVGDRAEGVVLQVARVGRIPGQHDLGSMFERQPPHLVHVDALRGGVEPVRHEVVLAAGEVDG